MQDFGAEFGAGGAEEVCFLGRRWVISWGIYLAGSRGARERR